MPSGTTDEQLIQAHAEAGPVKKREVQEFTGDYYRTLIKNIRDEVAMLQTDRGGNWELIPPGREIVLCSWSPRTMYAPFNKVVFEEGGKVNVTRRFNFKDPAEEAGYSLLLDNRDGGPQEVVQVDGEYVSAIRGIPRRVKISLLDPRVGCKAIVWRRRKVKVPAPSNPSYLLSKEIIEKVLVPRKAAELRAIRKEIEKRALAEARQKADQQFARIAPVEGEDDAETEGQAD